MSDEDRLRLQDIMIGLEADLRLVNWGHVILSSDRPLSLAALDAVAEARNAIQALLNTEKADDATEPSAK